MIFTPLLAKEYAIQERRVVTHHFFCFSKGCDVVYILHITEIKHPGMLHC